MKDPTLPIEFFTPSVPPSSLGVGCASHGLAAPSVWAAPEAVASAPWNHARARVFAGTFADAAAWAAHSPGPAIAFVFATGAAGVDAFLARLQSLWPDTPVVGGGAARAPGQPRGRVAPDAADVSIAVVTEGTWRVDAVNVLGPVGTVAFRRHADRELAALQIDPAGPWLPAVDAFAQLQHRLGKSPADHESITLSDAAGRNIHFHQDGNRMICGADLPAESEPLTLRAAAPEDIHQRLESLAAIPGSLVLGCAGLRATLPRPLRVAAGTVCAFLFGEIMPIAGRARFGNLMVCHVQRVG